MKLNQLTPGQTSTLLSFEDTQMGGKLMTMGMLPGCTLQLVRTMSAGKTFYIKVNGHGMALRAAEADTILINPIAN